MELSMYQVDAFAGRAFEGNPAAVVPLEGWLDDALMQSIAMENNLSETAFFVPAEAGYHIRWFTPVAEVDLCGHATLASAFVVLELLDPSLERVTFASRSGPLTVSRRGGLLAMDLPSQPPAPRAAPPGLARGLGKEPAEVLASRDYLAVYPREEDVRSLQPDMGELRKLGLRGVIVTAPGEEADFVSRFFAPSLGVDEDPVTGSAHCALAPYWAARLGRSELRALQLSRRGGEVFCEDRGERVVILGRAVLYLEGTIRV